MSDVRIGYPADNTSYTHATLARTFTREECDAIIALGRQKLEQAKIASGEVENEIRSSKVNFLFPSEETEWIFQRIKEVTDNVNDRLFHFDLRFFPNMQFTHYSTGDYYGWHMDLRPGKTKQLFTRKLSLSVILSDPLDHEGGELEINRYDNDGCEISLKPEQGTVVFFPSFIQHRVTKVTKGSRYSLVIWVEGDRFR
jgi:PKHD-type hydroxylase